MMSEPSAPGPKPRPRRGMKIVLAISLSLNLLVVGLLGGAALGLGRSVRGTDGAPGFHTLGLGPFALVLNRDDRQILRQRLRGDDILMERRAIGAALRDLRQALLADTFDQALAESALGRSRVAVLALQEAGHTAFVDQLAAMTPETRAAVADRLGRFQRRMSIRHGNHGRPHQ